MSTQHIGKADAGREPQGREKEAAAAKWPAEAEGLGPGGIGRFTVGVTPGVNDASAFIVDDFAPTRYELEVLANHYLDEINKIEWNGEFLGASGSWEIRFGPFASRRLGTIQGLLGEDDFDEALRATNKKWEKAFTESRKDPPCPSCLSSGNSNKKDQQLNLPTPTGPATKSSPSSYVVDRHRTAVRECLEHYNHVMGYTVELDPRLERLVACVIHNGMPHVKIKDACSWVAQSDFHRGVNDNCTKYDSLEWILAKPDRLRKQAKSWKARLKSARVEMQMVDGPVEPKYVSLFGGES